MVYLPTKLDDFDGKYTIVSIVYLDLPHISMGNIPYSLPTPHGAPYLPIFAGDVSLAHLGHLLADDSA